MSDGYFHIFLTKRKKLKCVRNIHLSFVRTDGLSIKYRLIDQATSNNVQIFPIFTLHANKNMADARVSAQCVRLFRAAHDMNLWLACQAFEPEDRIIKRTKNLLLNVLY